MGTRRQKKNDIDRFFAEIDECCLTHSCQCEECVEDEDEQVGEQVDGEFGHDI